MDLDKQSKESHEKCSRLLDLLYKTVDDFVDKEGYLDNREAFTAFSSMMMQVFCAQFPLTERKDRFKRFCEQMCEPGSPLYQDSISDLLPK